MGRRGLTRLQAALLSAGFVLFLGACSDKTPVDPGNPGAVDERAAALARFGAEKSAGIFYAFYGGHAQVPDPSIIDFRYSTTFIDSLDLESVVQRYPLYFNAFWDSCYYPYEALYGTLFPVYWGHSGFLGHPDTLMIYAGANSVKNARPGILLQMDSLVNVYIIYFGTFRSDRIAAESLSTEKYVYELQGTDNLCDSIEGTLASASGVPLEPGVLPDSGVFRKSLFYNRAEAAAAYGFHAKITAPAGVIKRFSRYARFHGAAVTDIDSLAQVFYFENDTNITIWRDSAFSVTSHGATVAHGRFTPPDRFTDTIATTAGTRVVHGRLPAGNAFTEAAVTSAAGDTLYRIIPGMDTLLLLTYGASSTDTLACAVADTVLTFKGGEGGAVFEVEARKVFHSLLITLVWRESASAGPSFSGNFLINAFTGIGAGAVYDAGNDVSYKVHIDLNGTSRLDDITL